MNDQTCCVNFPLYWPWFNFIECYFCWDQTFKLNNKLLSVSLEFWRKANVCSFSSTILILHLKVLRQRCKLCNLKIISCSKTFLWYITPEVWHLFCIKPLKNLSCHLIFLSLFKRTFLYERIVRFPSHYKLAFAELKIMSSFIIQIV